MNKTILIIALILLTFPVLHSCRDFLDVVPDGVPTLDNAFSNRHEAEKYLFTCYSYMPKNGTRSDDPSLVGGDELWEDVSEGGFFNIARGNQNVVQPYGDNWSRFFKAIRTCNIFLDHIEQVPDMDETEKRRWIGEVKFLKAYYNFYLVKMYGPIPLMKKNLPINVGVRAARVLRAPVDSCFSYIVSLLDQAVPYLPLVIDDPVNELGRITQPIALSLKAKVLVYAASPLFNGNAQEAALKNRDGTPLFATDYSAAKWDSAAAACKRAIDLCRQVGMKLYYYQPDFQQYQLSDTMMTQMSIRNSFAEQWNSEIIWANVQVDLSNTIKFSTPRWDPDNLDIFTIRGQLSPPLKIAAMYYTDHGVPIDQDKSWDYAGRYSLARAGDGDKLYIRKGYTTARFNFHRGPRFYADLGFDGGIWYGQGQYDDKDYLDLFYLQAKYRQRNNGLIKIEFGSNTGYFLKKFVYYQNVIGKKGNTYSVTAFPYPIIRLSGLYLLYAEASNESRGPNPEVFTYLNLVRQRAGLPTVQTSWDNYSINPTEYTTKDGLRKIIHRERLIELAFEGQRFWDLRRWKEAPAELNMPVRGWDLHQEDASAYYRPVLLFQQTFGLKDYFWPISENALEDNPNLVQNIGW